MRGTSSLNLPRDFVIILACTVVVFVLIEMFCQARCFETDYVFVVVEPGMSFKQIAERFASQGIITNKQIFMALSRLLGIEKKARAGRYRFERTSDMIDILRALYRGATFRERILILPGRTIEGVAHVLAQRAGVDSVGFVTLARDSVFVSSLGVPSKTAEGYLFPDTYEVEWNEKPATIITQMVRAFFKAFDDSMMMRAKHMGMSLNEVVTLASIIEKEAMLDRERPRISAVFHNRLRRGMKLQADPTVRYALKKWTGRLLYDDLKVDSPYNTYRVKGLPPAPICSPGLASLVAALYPMPGSDELYFVAQGDGSHYFSRTAREHLKAKQRYKRYLRKLRAQMAARAQSENAGRADGKKQGESEVNQRNK